MEARSCKFRTYSYKFRKGKITGAQVQFAPKLPQNGRLLAQNSPKSAKVARKLRSMAKIERLRENAKVALRNIAIFWWDYFSQTFPNIY